ncbi:hypothetical protein [Dactylosporangium sp. NPDC000521]|uniref:hypothetical protein n=1 Tax=Dactylosporangium sp. NPDC000521 TaxID=3363975 RepID=UPI0036AA6927
MAVNARRSAARWLIAGVVLAVIAAVIVAVLVIAARSGPRKLPVPTILRHCSEPSGSPPESRCASLLPTSAFTTA